MNHSYLLQQAAGHTYTVAREFDLKMNLTEEYKFDPDFSDDDIIAELVAKKLMKEVSKYQPLIFSVDEKLIYCRIPFPKGYFLLGPTRLTDVISYKTVFHTSNPPRAEKLSSSIPAYSIDMFSDDILLLYNIFRSGKTDKAFLDQHSLIMANCVFAENADNLMPSLHNTIFQNIENGFVHNPFSHEKRQVDSIQNGDVETLKEILKEKFPGRYGTLSDNPLRQDIYLGIVETTLASRAAIRGGLDPETAFYLSDVTIQQLDKCQDSATARHISYKMQTNYAQLVSDLNMPGNRSKTNNRHISRCKGYIFSHLHEKILVQDIASAIGLEENYLSSLFKKNEGITISQYIQNEKIRLAKNMLMYSPFSYTEIALYLGYSSHSHFGQAFHKATGMTPREYRLAYEKEDFIADMSGSVQNGA